MSQYPDRTEKERSVTAGWVAGFLRRHPSLIEQNSMIIEGSRADCCKRDNVEPFFERYEKLLKTNLFIPNLTFNLDETSLNFTTKFKGKAISRLNGYVPITATADRVPSVTLVLCIPMIGKALTTSLLWPQETIPDEFRNFLSYGIYIHLGCSFQTVQSFTSLMNSVYIPEMNLIRTKMNRSSSPILFIMDGHISRLNVSFIKECRKNNIVVLLLPAHTSNCTQPLDNGVNGLFKQTLAKTAARLINSGGEGMKCTEEKKSTDTPEPTENKPFPPVPLLFREMEGHTFRHVASEQRYLIAKSIPESLEKALEIKSIESSWKKTFLFFSSDTPFDKTKALESFRPGPRVSAPNRARYPNVSGRILTSSSCYKLLLEWKINQLEKNKDKQTLHPSKKVEIEGALKTLRMDLQELTQQIELQDKTSVQGIIDAIEEDMEKRFPAEIAGAEPPTNSRNKASSTGTMAKESLPDASKPQQLLSIADLPITIDNIEEITKITSVEVAQEYLRGINFLSEACFTMMSSSVAVRGRKPRQKLKNDLPPPPKTPSFLMKKKRLVRLPSNHLSKAAKLDGDYYYFPDSDSESTNSDQH